jgi:hypothetical protein
LDIFYPFNIKCLLQFYPFWLYNLRSFQSFSKENNMDFGRAFSYAFEDADWMKKIGIAALVLLIPLVGPIIVIGWGLEITRRVINLDPSPLPGWDDFGSYVSKGFQGFVVSLAYALPVLLVVGCGQVAIFGSTAALGNGDNSGMVGGLISVLSLCMGCFAVLFGIAAGLLVPAAIGNLAVTGQLGSAFRFNEVFGMFRAAPGPYILSLLVVGITAAVLSPIGGLLCGVGALATSAFISTVSSHLYGQAYNLAKAALGTPAP